VTDTGVWVTRVTEAIDYARGFADHQRREADMVEQRADLDYGANDKSLEDDLTHEPALDSDTTRANEVVAEQVVVLDEAEVDDEGDATPLT
jgi:hypothetical protein